MSALGFASAPGSIRNSRSTATACGASGTICSVFIFIRSAGILHKAFSLSRFSNSDHRAPRSSLVRTNVRATSREAGSRVALIGLERFKKVRNLIERHRLVPMGPAGRFECAFQVGRWVMFCPPRCDGIAKYLAAVLPEASGGLDRSTFLNLSQRVEQLGCIDGCNWSRYRHRYRQFFRLGIWTYNHMPWRKTSDNNSIGYE